MLARYLLERHRAGLAPSTVHDTVTAVRFRADALNQADPVGKQSKRILKMVVREGAGRGRGKVKGILQSDLEKMLRYCELEGGKRALRDACIFSTMFDGALRVGECVALNVENISFREDGSGTVRIRRGKTDQAGKGQDRFLGPPTVELLKRWLEVTGITEGPLFRPVRGTVVFDRRLGDCVMRGIIKRRAKQAGISGRVSGHSFRRGMAMELTRRGMTPQEIAQAGGWKTLNMVLRYTESERAARSTVARSIYGMEGG